MTNITQVSRNELTAAEIIDTIEDGGRVMIELSVLDTSTRVVIRQQNGTYYCDTPMKLFKHDDRTGLRTCLERFRLVRRNQDTKSEVASASA